MWPRSRRAETLFGWRRVRSLAQGGELSFALRLATPWYRTTNSVRFALVQGAFGMRRKQCVACCALSTRLMLSGRCPSRRNGHRSEVRPETLASSVREFCEPSTVHERAGSDGAAASPARWRARGACWLSSVPSLLVKANVSPSNSIAMLTVFTVMSPVACSCTGAKFNRSDPR